MIVRLDPGPPSFKGYHGILYLLSPLFSPPNANVTACPAKDDVNITNEVFEGIHMYPPLPATEPDHKSYTPISY